MITIYKNKQDFTNKNMPNIICVDFNDVYFNSITSQMIDDKAREMCLPQRVSAEDDGGELRV